MNSVLHAREEMLDIYLHCLVPPTAKVEETISRFKGRTSEDLGWVCTESKSNRVKMAEGEKVTGIVEPCEYSRKNIIL
jgi:hypothetical protein